ATTFLFMVLLPVDGNRNSAARGSEPAEAGLGISCELCGGFERAVDRVGRQDMLDHHRRRADRPCAIAQPGRDDPKVARREWEGPAEDPLAHAGEKLLARLRDVAG